MGFVATIIFFVLLGAVCCLAWFSLASLGLLAMPVAASIQGVIGLSACIGFVVGIVLQVMWG
jgi:hypothetical protein